MRSLDTVTSVPEPHRSTVGAPASATPPVSGVLVGVDLRGIQAYVYSGRRILDAVGRAALVAELTDTSDPVRGIADLVPDTCVVLRDAGGALTVVLPDAAAARDFTAWYTRSLRERAGDLTPVVAHVPYGPTAPVAAGPWAYDVDEALSVLPDRLRRARGYMSTLHDPAHGYGITAVCAVGGGPAEVIDPSRAQDDRPGVPERVSADVARARGIGRRWHRAHSAAWAAGAVTATGAPRLTLPMEVDRLGREPGDVSRIAVVHMDVNGLGAILGEYRDRAGDRAVPGSGALAQRRLSTRIAGLIEALARVLVRAVAATVRVDPGRAPVIPGEGGARPITLDHEPSGTVRLPVRPIVVAGDDLTVLCDARLALSLVRYVLDWLDVDPGRIGDPDDPRAALHRTLADAHGDRPGGGRVVARSDGRSHTTFVPTVGVGIAVQPVGAPLSLGHESCEAMCRTAKRHRVAAMEGGAPDEHTVAWTTRVDGVDRLLGRWEAARRGPLPRTALPLTGTGFAGFLDRYLAADAPGSLTADRDSRRRGWLISALVPLLESGVDPEPEIARRARVTGAPVDLPRDWTPAGLLDAVEMMDLYLDPGLSRALDPRLSAARRAPSRGASR
ncbi:hypothetical protein PWG71_20260 [Nocardiopsis sp. N85]|uniref:hypothetical protein n=1 Tax=Nocardiopsis sp. N85 TaxID=3029400 RepID=UPI00237F438D|nr:hypothetical protein [Nocardiopsis sp. N85]MDE3723731.1 hypothetical protein [Nocardiopsis sp. N85]